MHLTKLLFSPWQTASPSFPSCYPELQMLGWNYRWCEMKTVGAGSPGASQRAGKLCLPGAVALSCPLMPALHWSPNAGSFFAGLHTVSPSAGAPWHAQGYIHSGSVLAPLSPGRKAGRAGHEISLELQCPGIHLHPKHCMTAPTGTVVRWLLIWISFTGEWNGKGYPNQLQHEFSCEYFSFKSQLLFTETAACCDSLLLLKQSLAHTLARKTKGTVFT